MSDEEKKAIDSLKVISEYAGDNYLAKEHRRKLKMLIELVEKQSKEIEELKEKNRQSKMRIVQLENEITARIEDVNQYYTPNDKIKAKIKEWDKDIKWNNADDYYYAIKMMQSLLEKE